MNVSTIKAGEDYRTKFNGVGLRFCLVDDMVTIYTPTSNLGRFYLSRFGGQLSPAGIRKFLEECKQ